MASSEVKQPRVRTMTTDNAQTNTGFGSPTKKLPPFRLSESRLKKSHEQERQNWWQTTSALFTLLQHANTKLEQAEIRLAELEELATKDDLTGLYNRRGFMEAFARELDRAERGQSEGGLIIMIDLDNFKTINDTHGHAAGDAALKLFGKALQNEIRDMDVAGRLGGDEFALLFANADKRKTAARAQALAARLNNVSLIWKGNEIPVRASLGMKIYKAGDRIQRVFADADACLYSFKRKMKGMKMPA